MGVLVAVGVALGAKVLVAEAVGAGVSAAGSSPLNDGRAQACNSTAAKNSTKPTLRISNLFHV
jgi:hypothetical protein